MDTCNSGEVHGGLVERACCRLGTGHEGGGRRWGCKMSECFILQMMGQHSRGLNRGVKQQGPTV